MRKEYPFADKDDLARRLGYKNSGSLRTMASRLGITKEYEIPDLDGEIWGQCEDYPDYTFSNKGRVKSVERNKLLKQCVHEGYYDIRIKDRTGKNRTVRIHRMVADLFVEGKSDTKCVVNHKDSDKLNNDYENLEWCTHRHNAQHALRNVDYSYDANNRLQEHEVVSICEHLQEGLSIKEVMGKNPRYTRARVEKIRQRKHTSA